MKYKTVIERVDDELFDQQAWGPTIDLDIKIHLVYIAAQAVASTLGIKQLTHNSTALTQEPIQNDIKRLPLPNNIMQYREDLGISHVLLDNSVVVPLSGMISIERIIAMSSSSLHSARKLIAISLTNKALYSLNNTTVALVHALDFTKPNKEATGTAGSYEDADYPFDGVIAERCIQIVSAHVSGVQIRDMGAAQFHSLLSKGYGG